MNLMGVMRKSLQGVSSKSYGEAQFLVVSHFLEHKRVERFLKNKIVQMVSLTTAIFQEHRVLVKFNTDIDIYL